MELFDTDRWLMGVRDELTLREWWGILPAKMKLLCVAFVVAIVATGFIEHESVTVQQEAARAIQGPCSKYNGDAQMLVASMVMESYQPGENKPNECYYAYRSE